MDDYILLIAIAGVMLALGAVLGRMSRAAEVARLEERAAAALGDNDERFENLSNRVLREAVDDFATNSLTQLKATIEPLKSTITAVRDAVAAETLQRASLGGQIVQLVTTTTTVSQEANNLATVLRGNVQVRGRWGEVVLERILETADFVKDRDYIEQGVGLALVDGDGKPQKPDVIVYLPGEKSLIIDSKAPLPNYEAFVTATDKDEQVGYGKAFVRDMRGHIDELAKRHYQGNTKLKAHEFVLMFVPIEAAIAVAVTEDPRLADYAMRKRIVLVGPYSLVLVLSTIAALWRGERREENAERIAELAVQLLDKIAASLGEMVLVGKKLDEAQATWGDAVRRLSNGKGGVNFIGQQIRSLGVQAKSWPEIPAPVVSLADVGLE